MTNFSSKLNAIKTRQEETVVAQQREKEVRGIKRSELSLEHAKIIAQLLEAEKAAQEAADVIRDIDIYIKEQGKNLDPKVRAEIDALKMEAQGAQHELQKLQNRLQEITTEITSLKDPETKIVEEVTEVEPTKEEEYASMIDSRFDRYSKARNFPNVWGERKLTQPEDQEAVILWSESQLEEWIRDIENGFYDETLTSGLESIMGYIMARNHLNMEDYWDDLISKQEIAVKGKKSTDRGYQGSATLLGVTILEFSRGDEYMGNIDIVEGSLTEVVTKIFEKIKQIKQTQPEMILN